MKVELYPWFRDQYGAWLESTGRAADPGLPRFTPPLVEWETNFLQRGLEDILFAPNGRGGVWSELLPGGLETRDAYPIFTSGPPLRLLRENVCQMAAAARVIYERGWLRRHVTLERSQPTHRSAADGFDLLVKTAPDSILIWVETRRSAVELEKLVTDLRACSRRGPHSRDDCGFPQNHPRHEFCVANRPAYLWALAPDGELCFAVRWEANSLELEPLASLPPRSILELS